MSDKAAFRRQDIISIYGERPRCPITGLWQFVDPAHILGRGGKYQRKAHSSILNYIPLCREIHAGAYRDSNEMRHLFLRIALKNFNEAIRDGRYTIRPEDEEFRKISDDFINNNPY